MTAAPIFDPARLLHEQLAQASPDLMRQLLTTFVDALMSADADAVCGAPFGQASPDRTASRGDSAGCRWVAVRHAEDHVHLVVTLARQDGRAVSTFRDYYRVGEACRAVEDRYGLTVTPARDRTAAKRPTRAETEKAHRTGRAEPPRVTLAREVRYAAAAATTEDEFFTGLRAAGVLVRPRYSERTRGRSPGTPSPCPAAPRPTGDRCGSAAASSPPT